MKYKIRIYLSFFMIICLLSALTGCDLIKSGGFKAGVDQNTLDVLNNAINTLQKQPDAWKGVLEGSIKQLESSSIEVATKLKSLLDESISYAGDEFKCNVAFVGQYVMDSLTAIRAKLTNQPVPSPKSWVCHEEPSKFNLNFDASGKQYTIDEKIIALRGFNFSSANIPTVDLQDKNGKTLTSNIVKAELVTPYLIQINLQGGDFSQAPPASLLYLKWKDSTETNSISIIKNVATPPAQPSTEYKLIWRNHYDSDKLWEVKYTIPSLSEVHTGQFKSWCVEFKPDDYTVKKTTVVAKDEHFVGEPNWWAKPPYNLPELKERWFQIMDDEQWFVYEVNAVNK